MMAGRGSSMLVDLAKGLGQADDRVLRQDLMRLYTLNEIARYTNLRMKAAKAAGADPVPRPTRPSCR